MLTLTAKESAMLSAFISEGRECNGANSVDALLHDNMTFMSASDLCAALGWTAQEAGGVMSALDLKCLIADSGESARGASGTDWYATPKGIRLGFTLTEAA
jgi:prophage antirepressor-like protein